MNVKTLLLQLDDQLVSLKLAVARRATFEGDAKIAVKMAIRELRSTLNSIDSRVKQWEDR